MRYKLSDAKAMKRNDFINDLYNEGGWEVWTKNVGDEDDCYEWLQVTIGICACYTLGEIEISKYRRKKYIS